MAIIIENNLINSCVLNLLCLYCGIMGIIKDFFNNSKATIKSISTNTSWTTVENRKSYFSFDKGKANITNFLKAYAENPLVYMVINKIATTTASMPCTNESESKTSKVLELIKKPNTNQSEIEFKQELNESLLITGNALILFSDNSDFGIKETLHVLKVCNSNPKFKNGVLLGWDYVDDFNRKIYYSIDDVLHIKTTNTVSDNNNYIWGLSPLQAGWIVIKSSNEKFNAEASIFKNRGIAGILTNGSDTPMLTSERERMQEEFDNEIGGADKYNKVKISTTDLNYINLGMSPTDLKLLDGITSSMRIISSLYGMPSVLFNDTSNSSYNNYSTAVEISYSDVYIPLANKVNEKLSIFLSDKLGVDETIIIDLKRVEGAKATTNEIAQTLNTLSPLLANNIIENMTPNEIRDIVGLTNVDGGNVITPIETPNVNVNV